MQIATFAVPFGDVAAQDELNSFLRGHRVLQVDKAFAGNGWSFCVEWLDGKAAGTAADWKAKRIDYRDVLDEAAFGRFVKLRERRKAIAVEDGVPPYMVMTDAQMAEAAKMEELDVAALAKIDGFGEARVKKYAERMVNRQ